jgi:energy-converting hydrogenase Eha subunit A
MKGSRARAAIFKLLVPLYLTLITGTPRLVCFVPLMAFPAPVLRSGIIVPRKIAGQRSTQVAQIGAIRLMEAKSSAIGSKP